MRILVYQKLDAFWVLLVAGLQRSVLLGAVIQVSRKHVLLSLSFQSISQVAVGGLRGLLDDDGVWLDCVVEVEHVSGPETID